MTSNFLGEQLNYMLKQVNTVHMQCLRELEQYIYYIARCLGKNFDLNEIVNLTFEPSATPNGIAQAVVYPRSSVVDGEGVVNPMFFYGYTFAIKDDGIHLAFTENWDDFEKLRQRL